MKWFRSRAKHGARLALFALAVQVVLSFGHFHRDAAEAAPGIAPIAQSGAAAPGAIARHLSTTSKPSPAPGHKNHPHPGDYCAICAVMALAGTVMVSEPPVLRLPEAYDFLYLVTDAEFAHLAGSRVVFQPRAPPAS